MSVSSEVSRTDYTGNGAVSSYDFTFPVKSTSELRVFVQDANGQDVELFIEAGFTAVLNSNGTGTITLTAGNYTNGYKLSIQRGIPYTQTYNPSTSGAYNPASLGVALDRLCHEVIRLKGEVDRCIKIPYLEAGGDAVVKIKDNATNRASGTLGLDDGGNITVGVSTIATATVSAWAETLLDDSNAAAARVTLGGVSTSVDTVAAMTALTGNDRVGTIIVRGYSTKGDGGGGEFYWDAASTATADGGTIFASDAGGTGRFIRFPSPFVSVHAFGATGNGVANDRSAIQACLDASRNKFRVAFERRPYRCDTGLTIYAGETGIDFNGAALDFYSMPSGTALTFLNNNIDGNDQVAYNSACEYRDFYLVGNTSCTGMLIADDTYNFISNLRFINGGCRNFNIGCQIGNGSFCHNFIGWSFTGCVTGFKIPTGISNAAERITFIGCMFVNCSGTAIDCIGIGAGSLMLSDCSLDYNGRMINNEAMTIVVDSCHIEFSGDADFQFRVTGDNSHIMFRNSFFSVSGNKAAKEVFYTDSVNGGISVIGCHWGFSSNTYTLPALVNGSGRALFENNTCEQNSVKPVTASFASVIAYGDMESASAINEWALSGGTSPTRSNLQAYAGAWSLRVNGTVGQNNAASYTTAFKPGKFSASTFMYKTTVAAGGATFYVTLSYLSKSGAVLAIKDLTVTNDVGWVRGYLSFANPAPQGTEQVKLTFNVFGIGAAGCDCYVDNIWLTEL